MFDAGEGSEVLQPLRYEGAQRMSQNSGLNRRSFLRSAGLTALAAGAAGAGAPLTAAAGRPESFAPPSHGK
jgi:hypothetical protein